MRETKEDKVQGGTTGGAGRGQGEGSKGQGRRRTHRKLLGGVWPPEVQELRESWQRPRKKSSKVRLGRRGRGTAGKRGKQEGRRGRAQVEATADAWGTVGSNCGTEGRV